MASVRKRIAQLLAVAVLVSTLVWAWGTASAEDQSGEAARSAERPAVAERVDEATKESGGEPAPGPSDEKFAERVHLLSRWDELMHRRSTLRRELADTERELRQLRRQLWPRNHRMDDMWEHTRETIRDEYFAPEDWEKLREDLHRAGEEMWERVSERLGAHGQDLLPWIPDAVVERIAEKTNHSPEQVREFIQNGEWDFIFRPGHGDESDDQEASPQETAEEVDPALPSDGAPLSS